LPKKGTRVKRKVKVSEKMSGMPRLSKTPSYAAGVDEMTSADA